MVVEIRSEVSEDYKNIYGETFSSTALQIQLSAGTGQSRVWW